MKNKCKDCLDKKLRCQICGKFFTKEWLTSHTEREHQPNVLDNVTNKNKIILPEKQKRDSPSVTANGNRALILIGPKKIDKTY